MKKISIVSLAFLLLALPLSAQLPSQWNLPFKNFQDESLEPLSATYGQFGQVLYPSSKSLPGELSFGYTFGNAGLRFDILNDFRFAASLGSLGLGIYRYANPYTTNAGGVSEGAIFSFGLPLDRGFSLGYSLRVEDNAAQNNLYFQHRPFYWLSYALGLNRISVQNSWATAALSVRPFGEWWSLSYQFEMYSLSNFSHSFYSSFRFFNAISVQMKYDFRDFYAGLGVEIGDLAFRSQSGLISSVSNKQVALQNTVEVRFTGPLILPGKKNPAAPGAPPKKRTLFIPILLSGSIGDVEGHFDSGDYVPSLFDLRIIVNQILDAKDIGGVLFELRGPGLGYAGAQEIREEILRLKDGGKRVEVFAENLSQKDYFIASAADKIYLGKTGGVDIKGFETQGLYFKEFLELFGVSFDVIQAGNYKSFGEPMSRTNQSRYAKEEEEHILKIFSEKVFPVITEKRKLKLTPDALIQKGPYTPSEALTNGLVDRITYRDDLFAALGQEGAVFQDVSSLFQNDDRRWFGTWDDSVAIISIDGTISEGESFRSPLNGETVTGSDTVIRAVDAALHNPATRAIILRVNSGGGAVTASDYIWKRLAQVATDPVHPMLVIATFGDMAASGGYYVAAQSSRIFASPMTLTGSIGVIFSKPNLEGLLAKFKVRTDGVRIGTNAGIDSLFRGFSPEQREKVTAQIMESYREFLKIVREGRAGKKEISKEKMEDIGQGRVWTGQDALSNGLADEEGGIGSALEYIEDTLRLHEDRVSFVYYNPVAEGFGGLASLLGGFGFNAGKPAASAAPFNALDFAGSLLGIRKKSSGLVSRRLVQKKSPFTLPLWALEKEWLTRSGLQYRIPDEKLKQVK